MYISINFISFKINNYLVILKRLEFIIIKK
jgi:hypothetical protein